MLVISIKGRLISGFAAIAGLAVIIGVYAWLSLGEINQMLNNITDTSAPIVETADDLVMGLWEATKVAEEILGAPNIDEIDELANEFEELMAQYEVAEVELNTLVVDEDMLESLQSAGETQEILVVGVRDLVQLRHDYLRARNSVDRQIVAFDEVGAQLNVVLGELATANELEMAAAEQRGDELEAAGGTAAEVNAVLGELFERDFPMVRAAMVMQRLVIELQDTAGEYIYERDAAALEHISADFNAIYQAIGPQAELLEQFQETADDAEAMQLLRVEIEALHEIATGPDRLFAAHRGLVLTAAEMDRTISDLEVNADTVSDQLDRIATAADAVSDAADEEAAASVGRATQVMAVLVLITLAAAGGMVLIVVKMITRPIAGMTSAMDRLANGDVHVAVPSADRRDEIGAIAKAVQVFKDNAIEKLRLEQGRKDLEAEAAAEKQRAMDALADRFDQEVGGIVKTVTDQAAELQTTAQQLAAAVDQTEAQSGKATNAAGQASGNVKTVAAAADALSSAIGEVTDRLGGSARQLDATARGARDAQGRMDELLAAITQIDEVVTAINGVAEQTNLLALNATIEAARAGDAGKGFAVVASEVKGLANNTRQMTENIAVQLSAVKSASDGALAASRAIVQEVEGLNESTSAIASSMEHQSGATSEIGRNAQEAALGTEDVSNSIAGVQQASKDTARASGDVRDAAGSLGRQAKALDKAVNQFLKEVRAAGHTA